MAFRNPSEPRISLRRVVLLLLVGASACMALTRPGRWVASRLLPHPDARMASPLSLDSALLDVKFSLAVGLAFEDLNVTGNHEIRPVFAPTDQRLLERLARFGLWTDCVVFEQGTRPEDLQAHGCGNRETCERIAQAGWASTPSQRSSYAQSAWREWTLLLLDEQGRKLALATVSALRPGWTMHGDDSQPWAAQPDTSETNALPAVRSFHRGADGGIVAG